MQTGFFYVKLRPDVDSREERVTSDGRSIFLAEAFVKNRAYPVLAVDYRSEDGGRQTFYHIPQENNEIEWFPARFFLFARD